MTEAPATAESPEAEKPESEASNAENGKSKSKKSKSKKWHQFQQLSTSRFIIRGSSSITDKRFKMLSRGRQASAASVVAIVHGQLFEPRDWTPEFVDRSLDYGDRLFRVSQARARIPNDVYVVTSLLEQEFYVGDYKCRICTESGLVFGNLLTEARGAPKFEDGIRQFFTSAESRSFGVFTAQGMSMAIWNHPLCGYFYFDPSATDENGKKVPKSTKDSFACLIRSVELDDFLALFYDNLNFKFDSRYCIDRVSLVKVKPVGRGKYESQDAGDLVVDKRVLQAINPVELEETKLDCTKKAPKGAPLAKPAQPDEELFQEIPLKIEITNTSVEKRFAADPLVGQKLEDERFTYDDVKANVPPTFVPMPENAEVMVLHGWTHERSDVYKVRGPQSVANCVAAHAMRRVHPVRTWLRKTLDDVLALGDFVYADVKSDKPSIKNMTASDMDDARIKIEGQRFIVFADILTVVGTVTSKNPVVLSLKQGLEEFFINNVDGVLECASMPVAIWKEEDYFYMFDSRACDINGMHEPDKSQEKGKDKGKKDGNAPAERKVVRKCCVMRFRSLAALMGHYLKNLDPTKSNERFALRRINVLDDVPGLRYWHSFKPAAKGKSWILKGTMNSDAEIFEDHSRGVQGLAIPVVALVSAAVTMPQDWAREDVDEVVREGDSYFHWCIPLIDDGEAHSDDDKVLVLKNLKKSVYFKKCKASIERKESCVVGDLKAEPGGDLPNLEEGVRKFFETYQFGIIEANKKYFAIWRFEEELKDKTKVMGYYLYNEHPNDKFSHAAEPEVEANNSVNTNACVLRFLDPSEIVELLKDQLSTDEETDNSDFFIHEIKMSCISQPMSDEEIEKDMLTPEMPDLHAYTAIGDSGAFLAGSFNQMNEVLFRTDTRDRQQAANALATLAMTKIYDPHLWTQEVLDDILKLGDKLSEENANNLLEPDDEDPDNARLYLNPLEINREFFIGVNQIVVEVEDETTSGKISDLAKILEDFFFTNKMGVFRVDHIMLPIWKEDTVYFTMDPRGRDGGNATVYWFMDEQSLSEFLAGCVETTDGDFIIDGAMVENTYTESEKPEEEFITEDHWYNFVKIDEGVWKIEAKLPLTDESFEEENRGKQSAAVCVMAIVFSKVYRPRHWSDEIVDEVAITGEKLHSRNAERVGKNRRFHAKELISEFFLANRRIDLIIQDCVESGMLGSRKANIQNIASGVSNFFKKKQSGCVMITESINLAIWKHQDFFYCFEPGVALTRFENVSLLADHLLAYGEDDDDFEITGIDIVDWNKLPPWKFDPSPAVRPSNLPALNAYYRLPGKARAILRGFTHQAAEIFGEGIAGRQTAANCIISLAMAVIKNPITWTRKTLDEILTIGTNLHRESMKCVTKTCTLKPKDIVRIFHIGINVLAVDVQTTVTGIVAPAPPEPEVKGKKGKKAAKKKDKKKKGASTRERPPPPPPILLKDGLHKFFENNNAGIVFTGRYMVAIWKDSGVYFMYDPRSRNSEGMKDDENIDEGKSCVVWFACKEPFFDLLEANINDDEKYAKFEICRIIIRTIPIEPLPPAAAYKAVSEFTPPEKGTDCPNPPVLTADLLKQRKAKNKLDVELDVLFTQLDKELSILLGTTHNYQPIFPGENRGYQTTAIAAVAIVVAHLHAPSTWTPALIDASLKFGDILHTECVRLVRPGARNLSVSELLDVFVVGDVRARIHVQRNIAAGIFLEFDLANALQLFFSTNTHGIMHTATYAIPLVAHWGKFYFLDPTERNKFKKDSFEGAACLVKCENIPKLAKVIVRVCAFKEPTVYTLNAVHILDLHFFSQ